MPLTDLTLAELRDYCPVVPEPDDFDDFWAGTLAGARAVPQELSLVPVPGPITELLVEDLTFRGFGGDQVRGWVVRPRTTVALPAVVEFIGYNGGRGLPAEKLRWAASGFVHVVMDTRGQGSGWGTGGATADPHGAGPAFEGFMTRGIESPEEYFYRRVFTDAARLVEAVATLPFVDPARIAVTGGSQGGGITLAAAGLLGERVFAALPDVPFLCHFRRSVELTPGRPFTEVRSYLSVHRDRVAEVFRTLSYFDGAVFARRASAPALFSVGMMDDIVLPSSVFAAFHNYAADDRDIAAYEFNGHEGGETYHWQRQVEWLRERL
ncbi:acetylxylan esterase [Propionicimonas sp.]|uniref:acetylxylan esterase n=1 Tax=Propionicimonas sp. TaxID=1955623 RepID=UPI0039E56CA9